MAPEIDEISVGSTSMATSEFQRSRYGGFYGYSWATVLCHCMTCCNCLLVAGLATVVFLESREVAVLEDEVAADQKLVAQLRQEVQEKQEVKIQELDDEVQSQHNLTLLTLAGIFTLLTCLISMFHMSSHLQKMNQPVIQRKIIAILWMSPIYSVTSFLSLLYPPVEGYMAIIKDFYESYCIYTFLSFLILVLGRGSRENAVEVLAMHAHHLERPTKCFSRWYEAPPESSDSAKANAVITESQLYAMQFVFIRPLTTVLYVIHRYVIENEEETAAQTAATGGESSMMQVVNETGTRLLRFLQDDVSTVVPTNLTTPAPEEATLATYAPSAAPIWEDTAFATLAPTIMIEPEDFTQQTKEYFKSFGFFLAMVVNVSVFFAFTGLLKFYHSVHNDLAWCRPWPKFLTIKGVVFLTFWQGLAILILVNLDTSTSNEDPTARGHRYQNTLICCEMLLFSLTHWCVFPAEEWAVGYTPPEKVVQPGMGLQDFVSDVGQIYRNGRSRRHRRRRRGHRTSPRSAASNPQYHRPEHFSDDDNDEFVNRPPEGTRTSPNRRLVAHESSLDSSLENVHIRHFRDESPGLGTANRVRFFSDGSSIGAADDEEDDMELI